MHVGDVELPTSDVDLRHDTECPWDEELPTAGVELQHDAELPRDEYLPTGDVQLDADLPHHHVWPWQAFLNPIEQSKHWLDHCGVTSTKPTKRVRKVRFEGCEQATKTPRKKLAVRSCYNKKTRKSKSVIDIHLPTKSKTSTLIHLVFEISNEHVTVQESGQLKLSTRRGNVAESRLNSGANMSFISRRSGLSCCVHSLFLKDLLHDQASTETMNLFSIWMEGTLPDHILEHVVFVDALWYTMAPSVQKQVLQRYFKSFDVSKVVLCFFPIICRHHWTLCALYVNGHKNMHSLRSQKSHLMYFDSLGVVDPKDCMKSVYSVVQLLVDLMPKNPLASPIEELELKIVEVPKQTNNVDCGFYSIMCMKHLIAGILQGSISKAWLTREWFYYEDVCTLKMDLHTWAMQCLGKV